MRRVQKQTVLLASMALLCAVLAVLWISTRLALIRCMETNTVLKSGLDLLRAKLDDLEQVIEIMRMDLTRSQEDLYSHLYSSVASDTLGKTPKDVVSEYVRALEIKDWQAAYECQTMVPMTATEYAEAMERERDDCLDFSIESWQIRAENKARVIVTYRYRFENGTERTFKHEPWSVMRVDGMWKVKWLPRQ